MTENDLLTMYYAGDYAMCMSFQEFLMRYSCLLQSSDAVCHPSECERCGWNVSEHKRRVSRGLTVGRTGLYHFTVTREADTA